MASLDQAHALKRILYDRPYLGMYNNNNNNNDNNCIIYLPYLKTDKNRVAIWGWSGGGSMSLNCLFRFPDLYKTAISVAPGM